MKWTEISKSHQSHCSSCGRKYTEINRDKNILELDLDLIFKPWLCRLCVENIKKMYFKEFNAGEDNGED